MNLSEIIKYLEMPEYKELNYKLLSKEESNKLVFYIRSLESLLIKYDKEVSKYER